jgi:ElaA protein
VHPEPHEEIRVSSFRDLDTTTLYNLLKLRCDVFVVEQQCPYGDIDGRDTEPGTRHVWVQEGDEIHGYLRILAEDGFERIGRVVTSAAARERGGYGTRLMEQALTIIGNRPSVLDAMAHVTGFYERFGYTESGPRYVEDGIPHVPMTRD